MDEKLNAPNRFFIWKWANLLAFSLMYITMYIGRYNFNTVLPQISEELGLSQTVEQLLYSSVFFAYALGCLVNGYLADTHRPKVLIAIGASGSIFANIVMHFAGHWPVMLAISLLNGYMQSILWVSGIAIMVQWWKSEERGIAIGIANLSSSFSYLVMLILPNLIFSSSPDDWRDKLLLPVLLLGFFTIVFCMVSRETPKSVRLLPYQETEEKRLEEEILEATVAKEFFSVIYYFFKSKTLWCWCAIAFLSSLCRYGILTWIPMYYSTGSSEISFHHYMSNTGISIGMALGTLIIAFITGKYFNDNKGVAVTVCAGLCAAVVVVFPTMNSPLIAFIGMFFTGFFLFGINGLLWLYAMDSGTRIYAATITGIVNCFAYIGATFETNIFSFVLNVSGKWIFVFVTIDIICIAMVLLGCLICKWGAQETIFPEHEEVLFDLIRQR